MQETGWTFTATEPDARKQAHADARGFNVCPICPHSRRHADARRSWRKGAAYIKPRTPARTRACHDCGERGPILGRTDRRFCDRCLNEPRPVEENDYGVR